MVVFYAKKIDLRLQIFIIVASSYKLFTFHKVLVSCSVGLFEVFHGFGALSFVLGQMIPLLFGSVVLHELCLIESINTQL